MLTVLESTRLVPQSHGHQWKGSGDMTLYKQVKTAGIFPMSEYLAVHQTLTVSSWTKEALAFTAWSRYCKVEDFYATKYVLFSSFLYKLEMSILGIRDRARRSQHDLLQIPTSPQFGKAFIFWVVSMNLEHALRSWQSDPDTGRLAHKFILRPGHLSDKTKQNILNAYQMMWSLR